MFDHEVILNRFLVAGLERVAADIPEERLNERAPGNGHPPLWILGHLAVSAEMGLRVFGHRPDHIGWFRVFGPGSSDEIESPQDYSRAELLECISTKYPLLCEAAQGGDPDKLNQPHGVELLDGTPIVTLEHLVSHLLSTHLSFHLAQLSGWRRAAGFAHLF